MFQRAVACVKWDKWGRIMQEERGYLFPPQKEVVSVQSMKDKYRKDMTSTCASSATPEPAHSAVAVAVKFSFAIFVAPSREKIDMREMCVYGGGGGGTKVRWR